MIRAFPLLTSDWIRARLYHLLAPLVVLAVLLPLFNQTQLGELIEDQTINLRFRARAPFDPPSDPRLVFVAIDQQSLDRKELGRYPWPRHVITDFLTNLAKSDVVPHTLTFDILYTEKSADTAEDDALGNAIALFPSVITGTLSDDPSGLLSTIQAAEEKTKADLKNPGPTLPFTQIHGDVMNIRGSAIATLPIDQVRTQSLFGFVNDEPSSVDDMRHTIPLLIRVNDQVYPSLALQTLCQMLNVDSDKVEVNIGRNIVLTNSSHQSWTIPMNERGEYTINYRRNSSFDNNSISFGLLYDALKQGKPLPSIGQRTLLIGETATGLVDLGPTPIDSKSPLPYTHLNVINNVLRHDYLSFVPGFWVILGWALVTWPVLLRIKVAPLGEALFMPMAVALLYIVFAFLIFGLWSWLIALAWPVVCFGVVNFGGVVMRWHEEKQGREQIKQAFSRMLSPEVMGHLLDRPGNLKLGGSKRAVTILFSDIRDYTKFSEGLEEEELVRQLNIYFTRMVACVTGCGGTLHKFIGDAIMAVWGDIAAASLGAEQDARNAVRSALQMRRRLRELNEERHALNLSPLRIGIGLNHGEVLVGLIGAESRSEFTVMGDAVNVASRLEGVTKEFHTDLAISESVLLLLGNDFIVRRLGFIQLKGKTQATVVYEVLAEKADTSQAKMSPEVVARYEEAFDHFLARRFSDAEAGFLACDRLCPGDYCVNEYLAASRQFCAAPPPPEWDGRIVMKTK